MKKQLNVVVLVDPASIPDDDPTFLEEQEEQSAEYHIVAALRDLGHNVSIVGAERDVGRLVCHVEDQKPDIVFNMTEEFRGNRRHDANIAALLEMVGIPFTGTGSVGLMLCRSKALCKQLLAPHHIRVPGFAVLSPGQSMRIPKSLRYPMVVKPLYEDGSDGISNASRVENEAGLRERVRLVQERWRQPAIVEEYIDGRELYVSVLGNQRLQVFPARELFFRRDSDGGPVLATSRVKWDPEYRRKWGIEFGFADLSDPAFTRIARVCKRVFRLLQIQDYARIDVRLTDDGHLYILEVNPNPDISYGDELAEAAERSGVSYNNMVGRILRLALRRYNTLRQGADLAVRRKVDGCGVGNEEIRV